MDGLDAWVSQELGLDDEVDIQHPAGDLLYDHLHEAAVLRARFAEVEKGVTLSCL